MKKSKRVNPNKNKRLIISTVVITICLLSLLRQAHTQIDFNDLSERDLKNAGFYTYILPDDIEHTWVRSIYMKSFDYHCIYYMDSRDDRWNQITTRYFDRTDFKLSITFSPNDALFDNSIAMPIYIESEYFDEVALYYQSSGSHRILMKDKNGLEVAVSSALPMDDIISYAESLVPIGKYGDENPWTQCN